VQVESERSRVFGSGDWTGRNKDGGGEGKRCIGLANTEVCQRYTKVLRIDELLPLIHPGLCLIARPLYDIVRKNQK